MGKNVLSKCYGGDISRKRKLLENKKQVKLKNESSRQCRNSARCILAVLKMDDE